MSKLNIVLVVLLIIGVFFMSGCASNAETKASTYSFVGGSKGLELSFMSNQPPSDVYEGQSFTISIDVDNKGEADILEGRLILEGIDPKSFSITDATKPISALSGAKKVGDSSVPGGKEIITYNGVGKQVDFTTPPMTIRATAFYPYKTTAASLVCLKENIYAQATGGTEICKLTGEKSVESSGAPVQVTYVEELPNGFNIRIENVGSGIPFINEVDPTTVDPTTGKDADGNTATLVGKSSALSFGELNKVAIYAKIGDGIIPVNCMQSQILLQDKKAETFCSANLGEASGEFTDILTITLNYGYMQSVSKNIRVIDVPGLSSTKTCTGTAKLCEDIITLDECGASITLKQLGCTWTDECIGTPNACNTFTTEAACIAQHGCSWA